MARLSSYAADSVVSRNDILIGSDADNTNVTRNFSVGSLVDFISLEAGAVVDTNDYLDGVTTDSAAGTATFSIGDQDDVVLTLGTSAFKATSFFAAADHTHDLSDVVADNSITSTQLNVTGNGTSGQLLSSDGDGSFSWIDASNVTDTNFYLNSVTKNANDSVTFSVNGGSDFTVAFKSGAFTTVADITSEVKDDLSLTSADISGLGSLATVSQVTGDFLAADAVTKLKIKNEAVTEEKLNITAGNATADYVLASDGDDGFKWVANSASNYYLDGITQAGSVLTFSIGGGGTDVTFDFGSESAFKEMAGLVTSGDEIDTILAADRSTDKIAPAKHAHTRAHIVDLGDLGAKDSVDTADIETGAITAAKLSPSIGTDGQVLALNSSLELVWTAAGSGASNFIALGQTPSAFGTTGQILKVNSDADELEFANFEATNTSFFSASNSPSIGKVLAVDPNDDGSTGYKRLKWVDISTEGATNFTGLSDTADSLGTANQVAVMNSAGSKVVFSAVSAAMIADDAVTTAKIADDAITTAKVADDAITNALLAANSVDSDQYVDGSIDTAHIADSQITNAKMANDAIDSAQIADGAIDTIHIADSQITNAKMADDAIDSAEIADGAVDFVHLANEFKTVATAVTLSSSTTTATCSFTSAAVFPITLASGATNTTITYSNATIGQTKILKVTGSGGTGTVTITGTKLSGTLDQTSSTVNYIQVTCIGSSEYIYTISQSA